MQTFDLQGAGDFDSTHDVQDSVEDIGYQPCLGESCTLFIISNVREEHGCAMVTPQAIFLMLATYSQKARQSYRFHVC